MIGLPNSTFAQLYPAICTPGDVKFNRFDFKCAKIDKIILSENS